MMKKIWKSMMMMSCALVMMSCGNASKATFEDLAGDWAVVSVSGKAVNAEVAPFLGFNVAEKRLYGNAGCNSVMGELQSNEAGSIDFLGVASTKRMCADMATEDAILQAMGAVKGFSIEGEKLTLTDAEGKPLMELKRK